MGFLLSSVKKDLSRWGQDVAAILLWLSIPLFVGTLVTAMFAGADGAKPRGVLLIADQDDSFLSGLVAAAYSQGELGELISVEQVALDDGERRVDAGEASGLLIIPAGFGQAFVESEPASLTLRTNPAQTILPGIITDVTEILLDSGFYLHQLFGEEIDQVVGTTSGGVPDEALVTGIAVAVRQKMETASQHLFPPAIDVAVVEPPPEEPTAPIALLFLPGLILMAVMFAANGLAEDYWAERQSGTLRRLMHAPARLGGLVLGKAIAAAVIIAGIGGLTLAIGFLYHGIAWDRLPSALLWVSVSGVALFAWFSVLQMASSTQNAGSLISSVLLFPLLMAGGSFFPLAALPDWVAALGRRTPNGFVADRLTDEIVAGAAWSIGLQSWLLVLATAVAGLSLCAWRLKTGFARH